MRNKPINVPPLIHPDDAAPLVWPDDDGASGTRWPGDGRFDEDGFRIPLPAPPLPPGDGPLVGGDGPGDSGWF